MTNVGGEVLLSVQLPLMGDEPSLLSRVRHTPFIPLEDKCAHVGHDGNGDFLLGSGVTLHGSSYAK